MSTLNFAEVHNMIVFLSKPTKSAGFEQIIDFLNAHSIKDALIVNPPIYISCVEQFWTTTKAKNINKEAQIHAKVDGKKVVISEASIRIDLWVGDKGGIDFLPNETIFEQLSFMGDPIINVADEDLHEDIVPTHSNYPPLSRVNTLGNGEERLKLKELIELCTKLSDRVLNLETTKTAQAKKIANLKKRVKRLERKRKSISHGLKDYTWISDIDANQDIYLVNVYRDKDIFGVNDQDDTFMFDADKDLQGEEVIAEEDNVTSIRTHKNENNSLMLRKPNYLWNSWRKEENSLLPKRMKKREGDH
nr:hypothetical protein [Tanacetum cinerariifolium]